MVSYLNKLLWQSKRRKSVDISSRRPTPKTNDNTKDAIDDQEDNNNNTDNNCKTQKNNQQEDSQSVATNRDLDISIKSIKSTEKTSTTMNEEDNKKILTNKENLRHTDSGEGAQMSNQQLRPIDLNQRLASPGLILYVSLALISLLAASQSATCDQSGDIRRLDNNNLTPQINQRATPFITTIDWHRIGTRLAHQLSSGGFGTTAGGPGGWSGVSGSRWSYGPNDHNTRDSYRYPATRQNYLVRTFNRIRSRIGARNSIRVHNAFRDMAWQLLSRLSMPTPVIYELRRQHLYSPDEDLMNDSLFNKNTTRTIRTKRLLDNLLDNWQHHVNNDNKSPSRQNKNNHIDRSDDDDDEPEGFRERLRMRLDELVNLSRRSLFGRVIRVPSIFPFKRQEESSKLDNNSKPANQRPGKTPASSRRRNQRFSVVRRRKKESDRQMIQINGKQYYVDEDGELKELKDPAVV